jgi:hypothetical protein
MLLFIFNCNYSKLASADRRHKGKLIIQAYQELPPLVVTH